MRDLFKKAADKQIFFNTAPISLTQLIKSNGFNKLNLCRFLLFIISESVADFFYLRSEGSVSGILWIKIFKTENI